MDVYFQDYMAAFIGLISFVRSGFAVNLSFVKYFVIYLNPYDINKYFAYPNIIRFKFQNKIC